MVAIEVGEQIYLLYGGNENVGANPRLEGNIGLAISSDGGKSYVKQGIVINRDEVPNLGLAPFSILQMGGLYYLFMANFDSDPLSTYQCCYMTSADLVIWGNFTLMTGLESMAHSPCVIEDPADPSQLIMYYTSMVDSAISVKRCVATKANPSVWTQTGTAITTPAIYPTVRYNGDHYEMIFAKPFDGGYNVFKTASRDGITFPDSSTPLLQRGAPGEFDALYVTTPFRMGDLLFYSGRRDSAGYVGIGQARLSAVGGLSEWGWTVGVAATGSVRVRSGARGLVVTGGAPPYPAIMAMAHGKDKIYEVWVYDDLATDALYLNTFRIIDGAAGDSTVGIWTSTSTTHYIYRTLGGSYTASSVARTLGWHRFRFVVAADVKIYVDETLVATDSSFDTNDIETVGILGRGVGVIYADDYSVIDLSA